ncbi:hypothetical protein ACP4OV_010235 [Aristida adscensionis]
MESDDSDVYYEGNPKGDSDDDCEEDEELDEVDDDYDVEPPPSLRSPTPPPRQAAQPRPPLPQQVPLHRPPLPQQTPPPQPRPPAQPSRNGSDAVIRLFGVVITAVSPVTLLAPPSLLEGSTKDDDNGRKTRLPAKRRTQLFHVEIDQ